MAYTTKSPLSPTIHHDCIATHQRSLQIGLQCFRQAVSSHYPLCQLGDDLAYRGEAAVLLPDQTFHLQHSGSDCGGYARLHLFLLRLNLDQRLNQRITF